MRPSNVQPMGELRVPFEAAMAFGLSEKEIWAAVIEVWNQGGSEDPLDEVSGALARRILERERRALRSQHATRG